MSAYFGTDDTRAIQSALKARGYGELLGDPPVDGKFGANTRAALFHYLDIDDEDPLVSGSEVGDRIKIIRGREINLTQHYRELLARAELHGSRVHGVNVIADRIIGQRSRYEVVERQTGVPWYVIACLHNMEGNGDFRRHLHEGSPLTARTRWIPRGRPRSGNPPFTWEESAKDALAYDGLTQVKEWDLVNLLWTMERYNGIGYLRYHRDVPSPYLWSYSSVYSSGKYVSDGRWDANAVSKQCGCVPILKVLKNRKLITL